MRRLLAPSRRCLAQPKFVTGNASPPCAGDLDFKPWHPLARNGCRMSLSDKMLFEQLIDTGLPHSRVVLTDIVWIAVRFDGLVRAFSASLPCDRRLPAVTVQPIRSADHNRFASARITITSPPKGYEPPCSFRCRPPTSHGGRGNRLKHSNLQFGPP